MPWHSRRAAIEKLSYYRAWPAVVSRVGNRYDGSQAEGCAVRPALPGLDRASPASCRTIGLGNADPISGITVACTDSQQPSPSGDTRGSTQILGPARYCSGEACRAPRQLNPGDCYSHGPVAVRCGGESAPVVGSCAVSHPPPIAWIKLTAAFMRRPRICTAVRSSVRATVCAVITSR